MNTLCSNALFHMFGGIIEKTWLVWFCKLKLHNLSHFMQVVGVEQKPRELKN